LQAAIIKQAKDVAVMIMRFIFMRFNFPVYN
jgi:hypothetical protein